MLLICKFPGGADVLPMVVGKAVLEKLMFFLSVRLELYTSLLMIGTRDLILELLLFYDCDLLLLEENLVLSGRPFICHIVCGDHILASWGHNIGQWSLVCWVGTTCALLEERGIRILAKTTAHLRDIHVRWRFCNLVAWRTLQVPVILLILLHWHVSMKVLKGSWMCHLLS